MQCRVDSKRDQQKGRRKIAEIVYSGIATSTATAAQSMIAKTTLGAGADENTVVEYRLDVTANQKSGTYISSPVTYTAVAN